MDSLERMAESFQFIENWEDRYHYLTEIGQRPPALPETCKVPENHEAGFGGLAEMAMLGHR